MRAYKTASGYVVRLDPDEEILETLGQFVADREILGGTISGIGAIKNTTIGYFDLHHKQYRQRHFPDDVELVNLTGNLTWVEDKPLIHAHVTIAGDDFAAYGGHLFSAQIAVTGEFFVAVHDLRILRAPDERTGLKLIDGPS